MNDSSPAMAAMKTIADFNANNRDAPTAASSLARGTGNFARAKKRPAPRSDGKAKCCNKGCGKLFDASANAEDSCRHHTANPVFGKMEKCV